MIDHISGPFANDDGSDLIDILPSNFKELLLTLAREYINMLDTPQDLTSSQILLGEIKVAYSKYNQAKNNLRLRKQQFTEGEALSKIVQ